MTGDTTGLAKQKMITMSVSHTTATIYRQFSIMDVLYTVTFRRYKHVGGIILIKLPEKTPRLV